MSLTDSLSTLRQALQTESPSPAQIQDILDLWVLAEQRALSGKLAEIQQQGEVEIAQKAAAMRVELDAQNLESMREAGRASADLQSQIAATSTPRSTAITQESPQPTTEDAVQAKPIPAIKPSAAASESESPRPSEAISRQNPPAAPPSAPGKSVNTRYAVLKVGLNDRVAFVKHLFDGVDDDFQRVVAALATMESKQECENFLENAVYGDYDWSQKPEIAERFLTLVFARFE